MAEKQVSKILYKIELITLKYIPIVLAIIDLIHTVLSYYEILADVIGYIGGVSLLTIIFLYTSSYTFKFCYVHRIPIHYITLSNIIAAIDVYIGIPVSDLHMLYLYFILAGIFIILYVYFNHKYKKKLCFSYSNVCCSK